MQVSQANALRTSVSLVLDLHLVSEYVFLIQLHLLHPQYNNILWYLHSVLLLLIYHHLGNRLRGDLYCKIPADLHRRVLGTRAWRADSGGYAQGLVPPYPNPVLLLL